MDPISIGLGVVGLGLQLFGGMKTAKASQQNAQLSAGIAQDEQNVNIQKQTAVEASSRRMQMETFRNQQRLRAQATAAATNQGASFGTGLQGGLDQISNQSTLNNQGVNQSLETSHNIFNINSDISNKRIQQAYTQSDAATGQGLSSLGGSLVKAGPTIGAFGKDALAWGKSNLSGTGFAGPYV